MSAIAEQEWTYVDRDGWGSGPWDGEPDKIQWVDEATDLDCLIVRSPLGNLCGYVGVPLAHPWHGRAYGGDWEDKTSPEMQIDVHGGLTYSDFCQEGLPEGRGICHVALPGREPKVWWFGFDCAHSGDVSPGMDARSRAAGLPPMPRFGYESYRTVSYVRREVASLAAQLASVGADGLISTTDDTSRKEQARHE